MRSVNKVIIIGNVTRDPESKSSNNGQLITTFGIATNRYWTTSDGQKRSSTEFHEVVAWSRLAEVAEKLVKKGVPVYIEGYLKTRSWESEDGTRMRKTEIVIQDLILLERGQSEDSEIIAPDTNSNTSEIIDPDSEPDNQIIELETPSAPAPTPGSVNIDDDLGL